MNRRGRGTGGGSIKIGGAPGPDESAPLVKEAVLAVYGNK
jgi:hypothetical protein